MNRKRIITLILQEIIAEEESHPKNPVNNEEGNLREGEIWVNIIEIRNDKPS